jgi:alkanesulfonate monooxygenase SsuD/methylene tetrahydromethanopterin reductase-like flavin-dependent oxidoreductase (luciferase family)
MTNRGDLPLDKTSLGHKYVPMKLRIFCEPQQGASYGDILALALAAENEGFDAFFRSDHYLKMGSVIGLPGPTDAWTTLAGLARDTSRIRLGTLLTAATFRLPGPLAITVAQVDAMSGGRVELGLGAGWFDDEHAGIRNTVPSGRRTLRETRRAAGDHHRIMDNGSQCDVQFFWQALLTR